MRVHSKALACTMESSVEDATRCQFTCNATQRQLPALGLSTPQLASESDNLRHCLAERLPPFAASLALPASQPRSRIERWWPLDPIGPLVQNLVFVDA
jgi:hypothetical protein